MEYPTRGREWLFNYEQARNSLEVGLVRTGKYGEQLAQIPHQKMEDMTLVYRIHLGESGAFALVTNQLLEIYGITPEQLHRDALRNASVARPFSIREMDAILSQLAEFPTGSMEVDSRLCVATNSSMMQGASVIAYPGFMEEASKKMQGDFFILPSSVHEVLLLKDDGKTDYRDLEKIVAEVNRFAVEEDERLSDHVYHYDSQDRVFEMAEKYEDRKLARIEPKRSVLENLQEFGKNTVPRDSEKPKPQHGYEATL